MKTLRILLLLQLLLLSSSFAKEHPSNEIPMYGGEYKSHIEPNIKLSNSAAHLGWKYFSQGDYDTAIKRFNQAWMLNQNNVDALWGFGLVMGQRATKEEPIKNMRESVRCLDLAKSLDSKNERLIVDLAYAYTLLGAYLQQENLPTQNEFIKAYKLFERAKNIQPKYPMIYANWSILEFYKGNYSQAKKLLIEAKKYGYIPNPDYEKSLNENL